MLLKISENIQLLPITAEDQPKLMALISRIYPPVYKHLWKNEDSSFYLNNFYNLVNLKKELLDTNAEYYFVIYNFETVGIFRVQYNKPLADIPKQSSAYLNRIYLGTEAQGKGVAKQLFNWVEQRAKQKGYNLLWLKVMETQEQALKFYIKQGFKFSSKTKLPFKLLNKSFNSMHIMYKNL